MVSYLFVAGARPASLDDVAPIGPGGWVRLPAGEPGLRATRAVVTPGLAGVCAPAAASASELAALGAALAEAEEAAGLAIGQVPVIPVVETAAGLLAAAELARAPRVARLLLGEAALVRELRLTPGPDERELLWPRSMVVAASAAARIGAPLADICPDRDRFAESCAGLARLGFGGRICADDHQLKLAAEIFACA
ncbi:aldolase/citrate lyase family protein [Dactylosporangium sp. NPDC051541]|uniref:aldolase/citrate lyase family protein n=1 Tax=Dactylosporangium sp. NPDC051541 TaxID=3363977 RepID=UPI0037ADD5C4